MNKFKGGILKMLKQMFKKFFVTVCLVIFTVSIVVVNPVHADGNIDEMIQDALQKISPTLKKIPAEIKRVAIYSVEPDKKGKISIPSIQDQIITVLLESDRFFVIDRKSLKALLEEQKLSMTGVVDSMEMVKAGKIVGVKGFFYGSVEVSKEKFILNLKLIDVESSAIVYSKKFTGESTKVSRFGIGWGASTIKFGTNFTAGININAGDTPIGAAKSGSDLEKLNPMTIGHFVLSYKQSLKAFKIGQIGFDFSNKAQFAEEIKEKGVVITSSSFLISKARIIK